MQIESAQSATQSQEWLHAASRLLEQQRGPMTLKQLAKKVTGSDTSNKAKLFFSDFPQAAASTGSELKIFLWPGKQGRAAYAGESLRTAVETALLNVLERQPLTLSKAIEAVGRAFPATIVSRTRIVAEARIAARELAARNLLLLQPCNRQVVMLFSRSWIQRWSEFAKALPHATPVATQPNIQPPTTPALSEELPTLVARLQEAPGFFVPVSKLRATEEVLNLFDAAVLTLARQRHLLLAEYDGPQSLALENRSNYIQDRNGQLFLAVALPDQARTKA